MAGRVGGKVCPRGAARAGGGGAGGAVVDDDGSVGVDDLAEEAAGEEGEAVALGPGVIVFGEAGGAGDEVVGRGDVSTGEGDVVVHGEELADAVPVDLDELGGV